MPCWYQIDINYCSRVAFLNQLYFKNIWQAPIGCATKEVSKDGQRKCFKPQKLWKWDCAHCVGIICKANSAAEMFPKVFLEKPHRNQMPRAETRGEHHGLQETVMWEIYAALPLRTSYLCWGFSSTFFFLHVSARTWWLYFNYMFFKYSESPSQHIKFSHLVTTPMRKILSDWRAWENEISKPG